MFGVGTTVKMSGFEIWGVMSYVVIPTIGLLSKTPRKLLAKKLTDGGLNEESRQYLIPGLDEIKSKLDGLARKDLGASISFFKEGVTRLYSSLQKSGECRDKPSSSAGSSEKETDVEGATAMIPVTQSEQDVIKRVSQLSQNIGATNIASQEQYKSAKESFKDAKRLATEAFNNVALNIEDRILASKLRIASRILECLDDREPAVPDCLLYLTELQDLPAIQAMFSVWRDARSRFRARFNQKKRNDNVKSVQMINELLIEFITKCTSVEINFWPSIKIDSGFYHPLLDDPVLSEEIKEKGSQLPFILDHFYPFYPEIKEMALTSKGEILYLTFNILLVTENGKKKIFYAPPKENGEKAWKICCFAVDYNDNVYVVIESYSRDVPIQYKLLILDKNRDVIADRNLDIIEDPLSNSARTNVTKDGKVVIFCLETDTVYIFDSTDSKPGYKFPLLSTKVREFFRCGPTSCMSVSNKNEIIFIFRTLKNDISIHIVAIDGSLKRTMQLPLSSECGKTITSTAFNIADETILVNVITTTTTTYSFSMSGELLRKIDTTGELMRVLSHPNGRIALVENDRVVLI